MDHRLKKQEIQLSRQFLQL